MQQRSSIHQYISLSDEVQSALQAQRPVVALESTVIAHGLAYPRNIEVAQAMESTIRNEGAIPATVGIREGKIHIGLTLDEITRLGTAQQVQKVSRARPRKFSTGCRNRLSMAMGWRARWWTACTRLSHGQPWKA